MTATRSTTPRRLEQAQNVSMAMGSGWEISKQAAKMVLTNDNFATLIPGRSSSARTCTRRVSTYSQAAADDPVVPYYELMVYATILNINGGGLAPVPAAAAVLQVLHGASRW